MSYDLLYTECDYVDPGYFVGDEVCEPHGRGRREVLAKVWLPKKEPDSPHKATVLEMADAAGIEIAPTDVKYLTDLASEMDDGQARFMFASFIQDVLDRQAEAQRIADQEAADRAEADALGYSPRKLESAWAKLFRN